LQIKTLQGVLLESDQKAFFNPQRRMAAKHSAQFDQITIFSAKIHPLV
jgi:hypothetical protein